MLENACQLLAGEDFAAEASIFPAEEIPFPRESLGLVSCRVAPELNRHEVRRLVREASPHVREGMQLETSDGIVRWTWQRISLLAVKKG